MGIRADVQADLAAEMDAADSLADTVESFTATRTSIGDTFDPAAGSYTETVISYSGRGVFIDYEAAEVDGQHILMTDTKLIALQNEVLLDGGGVATPAVDDVVVGYDVINVRQDPAGATWEVQLRGDGAAFKWILSSGAWSDTGAWRDSEVWIDG